MEWFAKTGQPMPVLSIEELCELEASLRRAGSATLTETLRQASATLSKRNGKPRGDMSASPGSSNKDLTPRES